MSSLQKSLLTSKLPPLPNSRGKSGRAAMRQRDYTPVLWDKYFTGFQDVQVSGRGSFRVYTLGEEGPILMLLHGGGYNALTWAPFAVAISKLVECRVVAMDLRGHGSSTTAEDLDLSAATLAEDVGAVATELWGAYAPPPIVMMGHSMGGAIAVHAAVANHLPTLMGVVVIDVVEGTAMEALSSMQSFLRGRPKTFRTLESAIEWCIETNELAVNDIAGYVPAGGGDSAEAVDVNRITEEEEEGSSENQFCVPSLEPPKPKYRWRVDLAKSEQHWPGWFEGMSQLFLSVQPSKLLILAGIDTLDRELMVGQMQGRFQLQVLPKCGHAVHEDVPEEVANVMAAFLVRNKLAQPTAEYTPPMPAC